MPQYNGSRTNDLRRAQETNRADSKQPDDQTHSIPTTTPWIHKLIGGLYVKSLVAKVGEGVLRDDDGAIGDYARGGELQSLIDITGRRKERANEGYEEREFIRIEMGKDVVWIDEAKQQLGHDMALLDDIALKAGDCVIVHPGQDDLRDLDASGRPRIKVKKTLEDEDIKASTPDVWFGRIEYLYSEAGEGKAHVRWFLHGGETILMQTAGPKELFLLDRCDSVSLEAIAGKIKVDRLTMAGAVETRFQKTNEYFCRFWYDEPAEAIETDGHRFPVFEDARFHEHPFPLYDTNSRERCYSCEIQAKNIAALEHEVTVVGDIKADMTTNRILYNGQEYAVNDFVYIDPPNISKPFRIGQILHFRCRGAQGWMGTGPDMQNTLKETVQSVLVEARLYERWNNTLPSYQTEIDNGVKHVTRDERRLVLTDFTYTCEVKENLFGKCHVSHRKHFTNLEELEEYRSLQNTFWVQDRVKAGFFNNGSSHMGHLQQKKITSRDLERIEKLEYVFNDGKALLAKHQARWKRFAAAKRKLKALDIFAGCGGLTLGLHEGGAVDTKWAIEWDWAACATMQDNLPSITIYNEDANVMLKRAADEHHGKAGRPLMDGFKMLMPPMPKRGEIDLIYGGCPCQDFSGANVHKKENSLKNSLVTTFLSYLDWYRPKYFLLENVQGMYSHKFAEENPEVDTEDLENEDSSEGRKSRNDKKERAQENSEDGRGTKDKGPHIKRGTIKCILRALTSLGYSAQVKLLQAAEHGAPQSRGRVFFWGTKLGSKPPKYPEPSHLCRYDTHMAPNTYRLGRSAPHPGVSIGDAILDLPKFDWHIPRSWKVNSNPQAERADRARAALIRQVPAYHEPRDPLRKAPIGDEATEYSQDPFTNFQLEVRKENRSDLYVRNHYTMRWPELYTTRIWHIPFVSDKGEADHTMLPRELGIRRQEKTIEKAKKSGKDIDQKKKFVRRGVDRQFRTCLTALGPGSTNCAVLHPTQKRVYTVREYARAQGFPDWFAWSSRDMNVKEMYKQIGNAVSVQLGKALGVELFEREWANWMEELGEENGFVKKDETVLESVEFDGVDDDNDGDDLAVFDYDAQVQAQAQRESFGGGTQLTFSQQRKGYTQPGLGYREWSEPFELKGWSQSPSKKRPYLDGEDVAASPKSVKYEVAVEVEDVRRREMATTSQVIMIADSDDA
jgi:site-specific DNA-cytosine methylase